MPVKSRVALRPNRSLRAERVVSLASAALANRQIGFGRVRFALRPFPHRCVGKGANYAALGTGAFGRAGVVRACHRAARPAWGAPRIRRMRAIPLWRNTAIAAWPRPGGADERPAVREALGRASAPVPSSALKAPPSVFPTAQA